MTALRVSAHESGCTLTVRVHPGARRNALTGLHDGALKIALTAPPSDGQANDALLALLAAEFRLPRSAVELVAGHTSRTKIVRLHGISAERLQAEIEARLHPAGA